MTEQTSVDPGGKKRSFDPLADFQNPPNTVIPRVPLTPEQEQLVFASEAVKNRFRPESRGNTSLPIDQLLPGLQASLGTFGDLLTLVKQVNSLPPPSPGRPLVIGQTILPLVMRAWSSAAPDGNSQLLLQLYKKQHPHPQDPAKMKVDFPEWLKIPATLILLSPSAKNMPDHATYLGMSARLGGALTEIQGRLAEKQERLAKLQQQEDLALAKGKSLWSQQIATVNAQADEIRAEIPQLFERLDDVAADSVPKAINQLTIKVALHPVVVNQMVDFIKNTESLLKGLLVGDGKSSITMKLPYLSLGKGASVGTDTITISPAQADQIRADTKTIAGIIDSLLLARSNLREVLAGSDPFPDLQKTKAPATEVLRRPFTGLGVDTEKLWNAILTLEGTEIKTASLRLLGEQIHRASESEPAHCLDFTSNLVPLFWMVKNYFRSSSPDEKNRYLIEMSRSKRLVPEFCPLLVKIKTSLIAKDFQGVAQSISDGLEKATKSTDSFEMLVPAFSLAALLDDLEVESKLKNQIPDVERLKKVNDKLGKSHPNLQKYLTTLTLDALRKITPSLRDYGQDQDLSELWELVESFKILIDKPNILDGVPGNEGMRSGILLIGEPGVGKTHFVDCLATELGVTKFVISPDEGEVSAQKLMIDACRKIVDLAITTAKSKCCILFIDEADILMANRADPSTSQEQKELTTYLLQVINQIRKEHPRILIVAATNFADKIDSGMKRKGRFDVKVVMKKPGPHLRESLIRSVLNKEKISLPLSDEQMAELVQLTDGFITLSIIQPIHNANRFEREKADLAGRPFHFDFNFLKSLYEKEKEREAQTGSNTEIS